MTKVLFLAYYFPPVGGAGVQRTLKFVQHLPSLGFLPVVITGPGPTSDHWTPRDDTLIPEIPAGVPVYRVNEPAPSAPGKLRRRLETYVRLSSTFSQWWIQNATELASQVSEEVDLIFATMSPFEMATVAAEVSQRLGIPWVADLRDPWALDEIYQYPTLIHRRLELSKMEKQLSSASMIIMNTREAESVLRSAFPQLCDKEIITVSNGFDRDDFLSVLPPRKDQKFRLVHAGYFLTEKGLQLRKRRFYQLLGGVDTGVDPLTRSHIVLLEAVEKWCNQRPEVRSHLELTFAGKSSEEDRDLGVASSVSSLIRFTGYLSHSESLQLIRTADLLFLPMHNVLQGKRATTVPGKTFEYMASARPILAAVPDGDAREILTQCGTALLCRPDDPGGMAEILDRVYSAWLRGQPVERSNEAFVSQFERRVQAQVLAKAFNGLLGVETGPEIVLASS